MCSSRCGCQVSVSYSNVSAWSGLVARTRAQTGSDQPNLYSGWHTTSARKPQHWLWCAVSRRCILLFLCTSGSLRNIKDIRRFCFYWSHTFYFAVILWSILVVRPVYTLPTWGLSFATYLVQNVLPTARVFPGGHPSRYQPRLSLKVLDFGDLTGTGM